MFSDTAFLILETMETRHARSVLGMPNYVIVDTLSSNRDLNLYPSGRVFDTDGELKWQKKGATFQIVYIGSASQPSDSNSVIATLDDEHFTHKDTAIYLWGTSVSKEQLKDEMGFDEDEDIFIELQIPQYLKYPVKPQKKAARVQIRTRQFYTKTGQLEYFRFMEILEATQ